MSANLALTKELVGMPASEMTAWYKKNLTDDFTGVFAGGAVVLPAGVYVQVRVCGMATPLNAVPRVKRTPRHGVPCGRAAVPYFKSMRMCTCALRSVATL